MKKGDRDETDQACFSHEDRIMDIKITGLASNVR